MTAPTPSLPEFIGRFRSDNPSMEVSDHDLTAYWQQTYNTPAHEPVPAESVRPANVPTWDTFRDSIKPKLPNVPESDLKAYWQQEYGSQGATEHAPPDKPWTSDLKEIGRQAVAGAVVNLPKMVGQTVQAFSAPGSPNYEVGKMVVENAAAREPEWTPDLEGRGPVASALIRGARAIAPSVSPLAAYAGPAGFITGPLATIALFGGSQFQDTYDKIKAAGGSEADAWKAGLATGAIQGGGEVAGSLLALRVLGAGKPIVADTIKGVIDESIKSGILKPWIKAVAADVVGETATEIAQDVGTAVVERAYGLPTAEYKDIAIDSGTAALGLAVLLAPLGLPGHYGNAQRAKAIDQVLSNPHVASPQDREAVVTMLYTDAKRMNAPDADLWLQGALSDIREGQPIRRTTEPIIAAPAATPPPEKEPADHILASPTVDQAIQAAERALAEPTHEVTVEDLDRRLAEQARARELDQAIAAQRERLAGKETPSETAAIAPQPPPAAPVITVEEPVTRRAEAVPEEDLARERIRQERERLVAQQPAPVVFSGIQPGTGETPPSILWTATRDLPPTEVYPTGVPRGSIVSSDTLQKLGIQSPPLAPEGQRQLERAQLAYQRPQPTVMPETPVTGEVGKEIENLSPADLQRLGEQIKAATAEPLPTAESLKSAPVPQIGPPSMVREANPLTIQPVSATGTATSMTSRTPEPPVSAPPQVPSQPSSPAGVLAVPLSRSPEPGTVIPQAPSTGTAIHPAVEAYIASQPPAMRPYFEQKAKGFIPEAFVQMGGKAVPVKILEWLDKTTAMVETPSREVHTIREAPVKFSRLPGIPLPKYVKPIPSKVATEAVITAPRSTLPAEQSSHLEERADVAAEMVSQVEPGKRIFTDNPNGPGQIVTGVASTYPKFYGPLKMRKETVLRALEKIKRDKGADVGPTVEKVKKAILEDRDLDKIVGEFPALGEELKRPEYGASYAQIRGKNAGQTGLFGKEPTQEKAAAKPTPEQAALPMRVETEVGQRPIIGREATREEAPLLSKEAQTPEPQQTAMTALATALEQAAQTIRQASQPNEVALPETTREFPQLTGPSTVPTLSVPDLLASIRHELTAKDGLAQTPDLTRIERTYGASLIHQARQAIRTMAADTPERTELEQATEQLVHALKPATGTPFLQPMGPVEPVPTFFGEAVSPVTQESARLTIKKALRDLDSKVLSPGHFVDRIEGLYERLELKRQEQVFQEPPARLRGPDIIRERLLQAVRRGDLPREQMELAEWFLKGNEHLFTALGISVRQQTSGQSGAYNPLNRVMTLMKGTERADTAVHEMLHHLERLMPQEYQQAIRKEWDRQLASTYAQADGQTKQYLEAVLLANASNKTTDWEQAYSYINDGAVPYELYHLMNPSEWWAVNASGILQARHTGVWGRIRQWLVEALERIKGMLGLESEAPILKALSWLQSESTGKELSPSMLAEAKQYASLSGPSRGLDRLGTLTTAQQGALQHIHGSQQTWQEKLNAFKSDWKQTLTQGLFDQYAPILGYSKKGYLLARMAKGGDGTLEALLMYGKPYVDEDGAYRVEYSEKTGLNGFSKVLANLQGEEDRFLEWVAAQRAERLKEIGLEHLYRDTDIAALKTLNEGMMPDGKTSRKTTYSTALVQLNEWNAAMVKIAVDSKLIDPEVAKLFKDTPYVPFYRLHEEGVIPGFGMKPGLVNQYAWKKLKGGTEHLHDDLLANLLQNWSHLITASAKNRAAKVTLEAAVQAGVAQEVPAGMPGKGLVGFRDDVTKTIPASQEYEEGGKTKVSDGTAKITYNAERVFLVDDPALLDAVAALHYAGLGSIGKPFVTAKRWLTTAVTVNPAFKIRNLIRDSIQAIGTAELSYNPFQNIAQGFSATRLDSETRAQLLAGGGMIRFGSMLDGNNADRTRRLIEQGTDPGTILDGAGKLTHFWKTKVVPAFEAYQELGDRGEQISRAALYEQLRAKGMSHLEASFWARDLMDFSLSGKWEAVRILTQVVPFMNARLQGLYKLGRATKQDYRRMGTTLGAVGLASMALLWAYQDDDDWKKREDWDRDNYWWFKIGDVAFRLPKPFEIGAIGTIAERSLEYRLSDEMTGQRFRERVSATIFNQLSMNPTPQLAKPLMDLYANKDAFTGRPIETMGMERLRKEDRYTERTSEIAKVLGSLGLPDPTQLAMGQWNTLSPVQIDALVKGYFSWIGFTATTILDYGLRPLLGRGERPDLKLRDVFLAGNFIETLPAGSSRYVTALYNQAREIEQAYGSWRDAITRGDHEKAKDIFEEEKEKIRLYPKVEALKRQESAINAQIRRIEASQTLTGAEKRLRLDELEKRKNRVAQRMVITK